MEVLLATMTTPAQSLTQEHEPDELIRMILNMETMTREAYSYVWEIEEGYEDDIDTMEINNFCTSIASIRRRTPAIPMDHMPGNDHDTADGEDHGRRKTTEKAKSLDDEVCPDPGRTDTDGHEETRLCTKPTPTQDTPMSTAPTPRLSAESPQAYREGRRLGVGLWVEVLVLPVPDDISTTEMSLNKEHAAAVEAKQTTLGKTSTRL